MAYSLSNKCAKNLCKRAVLVQLIIENVVACFFGTQCILFTSLNCTTILMVNKYVYISTTSKTALCNASYGKNPIKLSH